MRLFHAGPKGARLCQQALKANRAQHCVRAMVHTGWKSYFCRLITCSKAAVIRIIVTVMLSAS